MRKNDTKTLALLGGAGLLAWWWMTRKKKCPYCGLEFDTEEELQAHIKEAHPGILEEVKAASYRNLKISLSSSRY